MLIHKNELSYFVHYFQINTMNVKLFRETVHALQIEPATFRTEDHHSATSGHHAPTYLIY